MSLSTSCLPAVPSSSLARQELSSAPSQHTPASGTAITIFMLAALYAVPVVVSLRLAGEPISDPDIWWHLRVGQWVCEHHTVPTTDPFSSYGADKPWIAYSWLFEVLIYRLYLMFGLVGIILYRVILSLAVVAALHRLIRRREPRFLVATVLTALAVLALVPVYSERPWLFTVLFTIVTLEVILDLREGRRTVRMWLLPLVYVLWANLHIQFIYGLFLLGLACLAPWLDVFFSRFLLSSLPRGERGDETASRGDWRLFLLTGLCLAATFLNPYRVELYKVVVEYATQPGVFRCINELRAMEFREPPDWVVLLLGAAAVFTLGRRQRLSSFELLLLASAGILAFRARRDLWFLVLAALAILTHRAVRSMPRSDTTEPGATGSSIPFRSWAIVTTLLVGLIGVLAWQRDLSEANLRHRVAGVFPVEATAVVAERGYPGPLFNDFNWGGFLIWSLPQRPVVLDGRTNLHGDERILRIGNTWGAGPGWRDDADLASAGVVLADAQTPLGCVLMLDDRFDMVYEDAIARVFVRHKHPEPAESQHKGIDSP